METIKLSQAFGLKWTKMTRWKIMHICQNAKAPPASTIETGDERERLDSSQQVQHLGECRSPDTLGWLLVLSASFHPASGLKTSIQPLMVTPYGFILSHLSTCFSSAASPSGSNDLINCLMASCDTTCPLWTARRCNRRYPHIALQYSVFVCSKRKNFFVVKAHSEVQFNQFVYTRCSVG